MNTEEHLPVREEARARLHPVLAAVMNAERTLALEAVVPEADQSMFAVHRDPSLASREQTEGSAPEADAAEPETPAADVEQNVRRRTQVRWVRPTELALQDGARATGWGLDLRAELAQRRLDARTEPQQDRPERSERAAKLPDPSVAGRRRSAQRQDPVRPGMGLR